MAKGTAEGAASDAQTAEAAASQSQTNALSSELGASGAKASAIEAKNLAVLAQGDAEGAASDAQVAESAASQSQTDALTAKLTASGAAATALQYEATALNASNCSQDAADAAIISALSASAEASSIGALTSQITDARAIEARINNGNNGHYAGNDWYFQLADTDESDIYQRVAKVAALSDGGAIYVDKYTFGTDDPEAELVPAIADFDDWDIISPYEGQVQELRTQDNNGNTIPQELYLKAPAAGYSFISHEIESSMVDGTGTRYRLSFTTGSTTSGVISGVALGTGTSIVDYPEYIGLLPTLGSLSTNTTYTIEFNGQPALYDIKVWILAGSNMNDEFTLRDISLTNITETSASTYTVTTNASSASSYEITHDLVNGAGDFYRTYSTSPIVTYGTRGTMAAPRNFSGRVLGYVAYKEFPQKFYIYSPYGDTTVDVYASVNESSVSDAPLREDITPKMATLSIPKGSMTTWSTDQLTAPLHETLTTSHRVRLAFVSAGAQIIGHVNKDNPNDLEVFELIPPLSNSELVSTSGTSDVSGYSYTNWEHHVEFDTKRSINLENLVNLIEAKAEGQLGATNAPQLSLLLEMTTTTDNTNYFKLGDITRDGNISTGDALKVDDYKDENISSFNKTDYLRVEGLIKTLCNNYSVIEHTFDYDGTEYSLFNNQPTDLSISKGRYVKIDDPNLYVGLFGYYDGSTADYAMSLPRGSLSDFYVFPNRTLSHFSITAVEPCKVTVYNKDGDKLYNINLTNASTESPAVASRGKTKNLIADIGNGKGPYTFMGTAPFYIVAQDNITRAMTTLLGAKQGILGGNIAQQAVASQINFVQSSVDDAVASVTETAESINGLEAQYSVKINNNGNVSGFGLASSNVSSATSAFVVQADRFAIVAPTGEDLDLTPDADLIPFDVTEGIVSIKNAFIKGLTSDNISAGSIQGTDIRASTKIQVYNPDNKEATYAALDGFDPLYRIYAGSSNPGSAPFAVTTRGDVVSDSLHFRGYRGAFFDSEYGFGVAALTEISDYVKQGRKGVSSGVVNSNLDINDDSTYIEIELFKNKHSASSSNVYQQFRLPANKFSVNKKFDFYSKEIAPWLVDLGTLAPGDEAMVIVEKFQSATNSVGVYHPIETTYGAGTGINYSVDGIDNQKARRYRAGELLKIQWSGDIGDAHITAGGFVTLANDLINQTPIGAGTEFPNSITMEVKGDGSTGNIVISRDGGATGGISYSIPSYSGQKEETILGTVSAASFNEIPSTIKIQPKRAGPLEESSTITNFMANNSDDTPWDASGKLTFNGINSYQNFSEDPDTKARQYRIITSPEIIDNVSVQASSHIDWRIDEDTAAVIDGFLSGYTVGAQIENDEFQAQNALAPGTYVWGVNVEYFDAQGNDISSLPHLTGIDRIIETEILGFYDEYYVEPTRKTIIENDACGTLVTSMANSYVESGGEAYGIAFSGNSFFMIENDFREGPQDFGQQALILGNTRFDQYVENWDHNLFVIGTRNSPEDDYTKKLHLTSSGDLYIGNTGTTQVATKGYVDDYNNIDASSIKIYSVDENEKRLESGTFYHDQGNDLFGAKLTGGNKMAAFKIDDLRGSNNNLDYNFYLTNSGLSLGKRTGETNSGIHFTWNAGATTGGNSHLKGTGLTMSAKSISVSNSMYVRGGNLFVYNGYINSEGVYTGGFSDNTKGVYFQETSGGAWVQQTIAYRPGTYTRETGLGTTSGTSLGGRDLNGYTFENTATRTQLWNITFDGGNDIWGMAIHVGSSASAVAGKNAFRDNHSSEQGKGMSASTCQWYYFGVSDGSHPDCVTATFFVPPGYFWRMYSTPGRDPGDNEYHNAHYTYI